MIKKLSIFKNILISYLLIVLVPLTVFEFYLISNVRLNYRQQILTQRDAGLKQSVEMLDVHLRECRSVAAKLSTNILISKYMVHQSVYDNYSAIKALELIRGSNEFFMDVGVYYYSDDFMTTASGKVELNLPERMYGMNEAETARFWRMLDSADTETLEVIRTSWRMFYFIPIPMGQGRAYGTAVFALDESFVRELFPQSYTDDNYVYILFNGNDLIATNMKYSGDVPQDMLSSVLEQDSVRWDGRDYYVQRRFSSVNPSCCVVFLNDTTALYPSVQSYTYVLIVSLLLLAVCITLATLFSMHMWMPIQELSQLLIRDRQKEMRWDNLKSTVQDTLVHKVQIEEALEDYYQIMRENMLLHLLHEKVGDEGDLQAEIRRVGLGENCEAACILVVYLSHLNYADSIFSELERYENCISAVEVGDAKHVVIGVFESSEEKADEMIRRVGNEILAGLQQKGEVQCHIGVGRIVPPQKLWMSYMQALAVARQNIGERFSVLRIGDAVNKSSILPEIYEKNMIFELSLSQGNEELALKTAGEMLEYTLNKTPTDYSFTRYCLINALIKVRKEEEGSKDERLDSLNHPWNDVNELLEESDNEAFWARLKEMIVRQCDYVNRISRLREDRYTRAVENYIRSNCMSKDFSLDSLVEEFGSTVTYWSRFVKERLGQGFSDYVWQLRLARAKELLRQDVAVKDVVDQVGFIDPRSFIRKFKNSEGITPGQYKTMYSKALKAEGGKAYEDENEDVSQ